MMNQIKSRSQTRTGRQIDKSARGDEIALDVIQIQPDNNFRTLKKQSCMDGHSIYDCFKCLAIHTLFESVNERQKIEPVPIPLPRASRNSPDVKTKNDFFFS